MEHFLTGEFAVKGIAGILPLSASGSQKYCVKGDISHSSILVLVVYAVLLYLIGVYELQGNEINNS